MWECVANDWTVRLHALSFVLSHCKKRSSSGADHVLGSDPDWTCHALCLALEDTSTLVQRAALDFLLVGLQLHATCPLSDGAMIQLVTAALDTLLRRNVSLNRRLFCWLLGTEMNQTVLPGSQKLEEKHTTNIAGYLTNNSKKFLIPSLLSILKASLSTCDIRAYSIVMMLLDKQEIGPQIIDDIILDIFRLVWFLWPSPLF